jgi:hypothetical protein
MNRKSNKALHFTARTAPKVKADVLFKKIDEMDGGREALHFKMPESSWQSRKSEVEIVMLQSELDFSSS